MASASTFGDSRGCWAQAVDAERNNAIRRRTNAFRMIRPLSDEE
jgi:hypothetical protein